MYTFHEINLLLRGFDAYQVKQAAALQQQQTNDPETAKLHLFEIYRFARPVLMGFTTTQLFPASFRAVIGALVAAADLFVNLNPPAAPVAEAAASSDTTTTDPTSTDPSFKAGKDL
jgi:hypothetical protein